MRTSRRRRRVVELAHDVVQKEGAAVAGRRAATACSASSRASTAARCSPCEPNSRRSRSPPARGRGVRRAARGRRRRRSTAMAAPVDFNRNPGRRGAARRAKAARDLAAAPRPQRGQHAPLVVADLGQLGDQAAARSGRRPAPEPRPWRRRAPPAARRGRGGGGPAPRRRERAARPTDRARSAGAPARRRASCALRCRRTPAGRAARGRVRRVEAGGEGVEVGAPARRAAFDEQQALRHEDEHLAARRAARRRGGLDAVDSATRLPWPGRVGDLSTRAAVVGAQLALTRAKPGAPGDQLVLTARARRGGAQGVVGALEQVGLAGGVLADDDVEAGGEGDAWRPGTSES